MTEQRALFAAVAIWHHMPKRHWSVSCWTAGTVRGCRRVELTSQASSWGLSQATCHVQPPMCCARRRKRRLTFSLLTSSRSGCLACAGYTLHMCHFLAVLQSCSATRLLRNTAIAAIHTLRTSASDRLRTHSRSPWMQGMLHAGGSGPRVFAAAGLAGCTTNALLYPLEVRRRTGAPADC